MLSVEEKVVYSRCVVQKVLCILKSNYISKLLLWLSVCIVIYNMSKINLNLCRSEANKITLNFFLT